VPAYLVDPDAEVLPKEVRIDFVANEDREVGQGTGPVVLDDLAEEVLEIGLTQPRAKEEQRAAAVQLGKGAAKVLRRQGDPPVLRVPDHKLGLKRAGASAVVGVLHYVAIARIAAIVSPRGAPRERLATDEPLESPQDGYVGSPQRREYALAVAG
jgi:hypothetical protein